MKQLRLLSAVAMLTLSSNLFAAVFTVNNANPSPGQYTTVAAAVAAASTGDTLMISGTDISYGNMTINKALTLIGPGWVVSGGGISRVAILGIQYNFYWTSSISYCICKWLINPTFKCNHS
jgi:hypothetical protein